jgi:parallel beta-helix repeat protein
MNRTAITCTSIVTLGLVAAAGLVAGPLNPPAGPVAATYKTLNEIEPGIPLNAANTPGDGDSFYKITQPGRYYLTGDITGVAGKHGIEIEASHVTIDFKGYRLLGVGGSLSGIDGNGTGPGSPTSAGYVTLKNGLITGWSGDGVTANNAGVWICEEMKFNQNSGVGITVNSGTVFTRCYFFGNGLSGCGTSNHVEFNYCFASQNGQHGYAAGTNSAFVHCEAGSNGGTGFYVPNLGGRAIGCTSTGNNGAGFSFGDGGSLQDCRSDVNLNIGIIVGKGGSVSKCSVNGNGISGSFAGIQAQLAAGTLTTATITDCIITSNTGWGINANGGTIRGCMAESNSAGGISIGSNGVISECTSKSNTGNGISANQSVAILNCTVSANTIHGIQISDDCVVRGNACDSNGSAVANGSGIYVPSISFPLTNSDNRIEGNNCSDNDYGIQVLYSGNVIIRNTCTGNATANFNISASNTKGTIVVATGVDITTSNSFANFEY